MPTEPHTPTLAEVVRAAADAADPNGADAGVTELITRFEDRDEPVSAVPEVEQELAEAQRSIDVDGGGEALSTTVAVATYLAFRRDQIGEPADDLIRRATAAENGG